MRRRRCGPAGQAFRRPCAAAAGLRSTIHRACGFSRCHRRLLRSRGRPQPLPGLVAAAHCVVLARGLGTYPRSMAASCAAAARAIARLEPKAAARAAPPMGIATVGGRAHACRRLSPRSAHRAPGRAWVRIGALRRRIACRDSARPSQSAVARHHGPVSKRSLPGRRARQIGTAARGRSPESGYRAQHPPPSACFCAGELCRSSRDGALRQVEVEPGRIALPQADLGDARQLGGERVLARSGSDFVLRAQPVEPSRKYFARRLVLRVAQGPARHFLPCGAEAIVDVGLAADAHATLGQPHIRYNAGLSAARCAAAVAAHVHWRDRAQLPRLRPLASSSWRAAPTAARLQQRAHDGGRWQFRRLGGAAQACWQASTSRPRAIRRRGMGRRESRRGDGMRRRFVIPASRKTEWALTSRRPWGWAIRALRWPSTVRVLGAAATDLMRLAGRCLLGSTSATSRRARSPESWRS